MKIGELSRLSGVNASAIRYYERMGIVPRAERASGQRRYAREAINRILLIRFAREMDFTLDEIRIFLAGLNEKSPIGPRWKKLAERKLREVEEGVRRAKLLKDLLEHLLHCRCAALQACVERLQLSPRLNLVRESAKRRRKRDDQDG
jgi:MerR family transcriptional regulator, redox-sensitive transcriptional activator SoxR